MVHRFTSHGLLALSVWFAGLVSPADAGEILRSPGWLAVLPDDSQPSVSEVRAKGREWFVDANKGDDMGAGSKASPWKTLARLKRASLGTGDVIRLRCGSVWRESLFIDGHSWPVGVTLASEGACPVGAMPSIRGSDVVESTWQADPSQPGVSVVDRFGGVQGLIFKGQRMLPARMPNSAGVGQEYALADGMNSPRSFRLREAERKLVGDRDPVGAAVNVRVVPWQVERAVVKAYEPTTGLVTLDKDLSSPILTGAGYILEGKRWMLDAPGEWFHDNQAKRLHFMAPDRQRPRSGDAEVVVRVHAISVRGGRQLRITGLDLRWTTQIAMLAESVEQITLDNLSLIEPGEYAVVIDRSQGAQVRRLLVRGAGWASIMTRDTDDASIDANVLLDSGLAGRAAGSRAAIITGGERNQVTNNRIIRSANAGIIFANKAGARVNRNLVLLPCMRMTDCGGIYTWTGHSPALAMRKRNRLAVVSDNHVLGSAGNLEGAAGRGRNLSIGVYLDEMTGGVTVEENFIAGVEVGLYLHNAQFNEFLHNKVRAVVHAGFMASNTLPDANVVRGNRIAGNFFVSKPPGPGTEEVFAYKWIQRSDPTSMFAGDAANEVDSNKVMRVGVEGRTRWLIGQGASTRVLAPSEWTAFARKDQEIALPVPPDPPLKRQQDAVSLILDGDFASNSSGWAPYFNPNGAGGKLVKASCGGASCVQLLTGHPGDVLSSKSFKLDPRPGRNRYLLRYVAKAGARATVVKATIRRNGTPYDNLGLEQSPARIEAGQAMQFELPFDAVSDEPARIDFSAEPGSEVFLSKVSLVRQTVAAGRQITQGGSLVLLNADGSVRSLSCKESGLQDCAVIDDDGREVSWPINLKPFTPVVLHAKRNSN